MAAGSGYQVNPSALDTAATAYHDAGTAVQEAFSKFWATAGALSPGAFGRLPQSDQLRATYDKFLSQVKTDMTALAKSLDGGGTKLGTCASNYRACESANTISGG